MARFSKLGAAGVLGSGAANVATQINSRRLYGSMARSYGALDRGYSAHLARYGLRQNKHRALTSGYYGKMLKAQIQDENSLVGSFGTASGSVGASAVMFRSSKRWL